MVGQMGAALQIIAWEHPGEKTRMSTVQCGLKRTLKECMHDLLPLFLKASHILGQYVYIVGLVSNWLVIRDSTIRVTDWKHFYDQVFSAVEACASGADVGKNKAYVSEVNAFMSGMKTSLPQKVDFDMRQEQAAEMAENAILHLKCFPTRLQSYLKHRFMDLQVERLGDILCDLDVGNHMYTTLRTGCYDAIHASLAKLKLLFVGVPIWRILKLLHSEHIFVNSRIVMPHVFTAFRVRIHLED